MSLRPDAVEFVLAFADDEHFIGQRHTEWIGICPFLEEDLAFTSLAQDELGHAAALYALIDPAVDHLAFRRHPDDYRSAHLVELPGTDWARALVRQWLYDLAERHRWEAIVAADHPDLVPVARRALAEERYHRRHGEVMMRRLLDAGGEARQRLVTALQDLVGVAAGLFEPVSGEAGAIEAGVVATAGPDLLEPWWSEVEELLTATGVSIDRPRLDPDTQRGRTVRTPHFAALHADINTVFDLDPDAVW